VNTITKRAFTFTLNAPLVAPRLVSAARQRTVTRLKALSSAEGPEFELESITLQNGDGKSHEISEDAFYAILGQDQGDYLIEQAMEDACDSGEFG
jgi:hypothetical protein